MSHVAMSGFNTMNRVVKLYKFAYGRQKITFDKFSIPLKTARTCPDMRLRYKYNLIHSCFGMFNLIREKIGKC